MVEAACREAENVLLDQHLFSSGEIFRGLRDCHEDAYCYLQVFHGDSTDCIIVATAIENGASLVTADEKILSWEPLQ